MYKRQVLGLPLVGSSLAQMALHVADTVMLGWYGVVALAAVVLGSSSFFILFVLGSGFAKAVMPMVASARAAGDETQVRRDARMGLWLSAAYGVLIYPVFWWAEPILLALGQEAEVSAIAGDYLRIAGLGMVPALWVAVLQSWLSALGRTQVVLWVTVAALGLNVAINWALIFGNWGFPELGARGAAVATLAVQIASFLALAPYAALQPGLRPYRLFQRFWRADPVALRRATYTLSQLHHLLQEREARLRLERLHLARAERAHDAAYPKQDRFRPTPRTRMCRRLRSLRAFGRARREAGEAPGADASARFRPAGAPLSEGPARTRTRARPDGRRREGANVCQLTNPMVATWRCRSADASTVYNPIQTGYWIPPTG